MSELLLIPVPGTLPGGAPVVRVVVVPKLDPAAAVAASELGDWPTRLAAATFELELASGAVAATVVHEASIDTWQALLGTLPVEAAAPPAIGDPPVVRSTSTEAASVEGSYRATAGTDLDIDAANTAPLGVEAARQLRANWAGLEPVASTGQAATATAATDEFHRVVAVLREHPAVMRRLGLIFDLVPDAAAQLGTSGTVRVRWPTKPDDLPPVSSPRASYEVHAERGLVPGRSVLVRAGVLDLGDESGWATTTIDVDNAVPRLRDAAATLPAAPDAGQEQAVDGAVRLPALRTAGIVLLRRGRVDDFVRRRDVAANNAARASLEDAEPLDAEALMLGLRIDVRPLGAGTWTSLMERDARDLVGGAAVAELREEGHLKLGAAVRQDDGTLATDEIVARWDGWSLAVGARLGSGGRRVRPKRAIDFDWAFEVPAGSLLPLRFSSDYHLRARVADLAGGGVGREDDDVVVGTARIPYRRLEPVSAPTMAAVLGDLGPGGTADVLVIRADAPEYPPNFERMMSAPLTTVDVAEQHGMLDGNDEATFDRVRRATASGLADPAADGMTLFVVPEPAGVVARPVQVGWRGDWPDAAPQRIELVPRVDADQPVIEPVPGDDLVRVILAPAEQAAIEVSSFLRADFPDHFALRRWRLAGDGDEPAAVGDDIVRLGRHPMATPARRLTFIHAVRKPFAEPQGTLAPTQTAGGMSAVLTPSTPLFGLDPASTADVQIAASWNDRDDDVAVRHDHVALQHVPIGRGDADLAETVVQHFGDTRHRLVTYSITGVSRFRHLYRNDEDDDLFLVRADSAAVSIKSTVRPPPPVVRSVVPAFRWTTSSQRGVVRRTRSGGILRVELARPWFLTGVGEQLAVLVERCEAARDPIWNTPTPARSLEAASFTGASVAATAAADGAAVTVAAYDPAFGGEWWAADVELAALAETSYRPFVRLAVARYQRESLPGLDVSASVTTDLVQLLPERRLIVDSSADDVAVTLVGLGPDGPLPNRVDVVVEVADDSVRGDLAVLVPGDGVDGWRPVDVVVGSLGDTIRVADPGGRRRVRVHERELLTPTETGSSTEGETWERVVFTDVVELA